MTSSLSAIHAPPNLTRIRRRSGSANSSRSGSGPGTRNRPIAPGASGPCCQARPMVSVLSGQRLAAVDVQRLAGEERAGHGEQDSLGDVGRPADAPGRVARPHLGEVVGLALLAEAVPRAGVDDTGRD